MASVVRLNMLLRERDGYDVRDLLQRPGLKEDARTHRWRLHGDRAEAAAQREWAALPVSVAGLTPEARQLLKDHLDRRMPVPRFAHGSLLVALVRADRAAAVWLEAHGLEDDPETTPTRT